VLAIQGRGDEYGTMAQIDAIERAVPGARSLRLEGCGHSPHRNCPDPVTEAVLAFVRRRVL
jgi:pimeloyl-ACP methyl ester carboxylesterase